MAAPWPRVRREQRVGISAEKSSRPGVRVFPGRQVRACMYKSPKFYMFDYNL